MKVPSLITKSESFNFLREFWQDNKATIRTPMELLKRAKEAFGQLSLDERKIYQGDNYIYTRLATDVFEMQMANNHIDWDMYYDRKTKRKLRSKSKTKSKAKTTLSLSKRSLKKFKKKRAKNQRVRS